MHTFTGRGGSIYQVGDRYEFCGVPLHDCGDGWDWRSSLRCWNDVQFEVLESDWEIIEPLEIYPLSGRVAFDRCLRGQQVRFSGSCHPTTLLGTGEKWKVEVESVVRLASVIGSDDVHTKARRGEAYASIEGIDNLPADRVFALLPFLKGVFVGLGRVRPELGMKIIFDHEGVLYEPA